ncbi:MAG: OmpA family protein [Pseudomonadota bacterium]
MKKSGIASSMAGLAVAAAAALFVAGCCGKYKDQIADMEKTMDSVKKEHAGVKQDLETQITKLEEYNSALQEELAKLGFDKASLDAKYSDVQKDLDAKTKDIAAKQKMIDEMKKKEAAAKARLSVMKNMLTKFKTMIEAGKLKVKVKNGKMVLELPSAILFPSGKADLSEEGQATLTEVAAVLSQIADREFQVAGHTDNVPIKTQKFKSNWHLSTARGVSVVEFLQANGVAPTTLSAAGYSEYQPTAGNDSDDGKTQNRRIEITLMPNLDELPDLSDLEKELE